MLTNLCTRSAIARCDGVFGGETYEDDELPLEVCDVPAATLAARATAGAADDDAWNCCCCLLEGDFEGDVDGDSDGDLSGDVGGECGGGGGLLESAPFEGLV